jgi:hypothetical protein
MLCGRRSLALSGCSSALPSGFEHSIGATTKKMRGRIPILPRSALQSETVITDASSRRSSGDRNNGEQPSMLPRKAAEPNSRRANSNEVQPGSNNR